MDVRLSAEQDALRAAAAQMVDRLGPKAVGQIAEAGRAAKLDAAVADSGWRELRSGTDGGGPLASGVEAALVAEQLGRRLADVPFIGPTLATELRRLAGSPDGQPLETVALDPTLVSVARGVGDGAPDAVAVDAQGATGALLLAGGERGALLARVELSGAPVGLDLTRPSMAIASATPLVTVPSAERAVTEEDLMRWTALGLSLACADLVGTMHGAVRLGCDHAVGRRQFGTAIGSFQAVQHMLADAYVAMEGSRSIALHAAWAVDALPAADALAAAAAAKAYCARAARSACETVIQVHGGMGNTWECLAHVYLRRALLSGDLLGNAAASLARVVQHHGLVGRDGLR